MTPTEHLSQEIQRLLTQTLESIGIPPEQLAQERTTLLSLFTYQCLALIEDLVNAKSFSAIEPLFSRATSLHEKTALLISCLPKDVSLTDIYGQALYDATRVYLAHRQHFPYYG